jgi:FKBP-type peptidyl-prolyl cis-trans isomerase
LESRLLLSSAMSVQGDPDTGALNVLSAITSGESNPSQGTFTDFGATTFGLALTRTYTITNTGNSTLDLTGPTLVTISAGDAQGFTVLSQPGSNAIAPGDTATFTVEFSSHLDGSHSATVSIASDDPTGPFTFEVSSDVLDTISPATSTWLGTSGYGTGSGASKGQLLAMAYNGYLTDGSMFASAAQASPFHFTLGAGQVIAGWDDALPGLEMGQLRSLVVPPAAGYGSAGTTASGGIVGANATLIYTTTLEDIVSLSGKGGNAIAGGETSPSTSNGTDFGAFTSLTDPPFTQTFTVTFANGTASFGNPAVSITGSNAFTVSQPTVTSTGANGATATFGVTYTPTAGLSSATVTVADGGSNGFPDLTFDVEAGEHPPAPLISVQGSSDTGALNTLAPITSGERSPSLQTFTDFGPTDPGTPLTRTYTITEMGSSTLNLNGTTSGPSVTLTGSTPVTIAGDTTDFSVLNQANVNILGILSFTIQYSPTAAGNGTAIVSIASDDPAGPFTFEISGESDAVTLLGPGMFANTTTEFSGPAVSDGQLLLVSYTGFRTDGTIFATSGSEPAEAVLGASQNTAPWEAPLPGMQVGQERTVIFPPQGGIVLSGAAESSVTPDGGTTVGGGSPDASFSTIYEVTIEDVLSMAGVVDGNAVPVLSTEATFHATTGIVFFPVPLDTAPSTTNGTDFGTFDGRVVTPKTQTFQITSAAGDISSLLSANPITISGSPAFTVTEPTYNGNTATFTVTYTPTIGSTSATVTIATAEGDQGLTFKVQADDQLPGAITEADMNWISGYAYNPQNLGETLNITVVISGGPTQTFQADQPNAKARSLTGSADHGFQYATPMLSTGSHTVMIYAEQSGSADQSLLGTYTVTSQNSLFDEHYYLQQNPDVAAAVAAGKIETGYDHYIKYGQYEGRSPSPFWNESYYLTKNPDVAAAVADGRISSGFMHFYLYGQFEDRPGLLYFDRVYYMANNPDIVNAVVSGAISAYAHYVLYGQYEGRSPMLYFSRSVYATDNPDIAPYVTGEPFISNYEHFVLYGQYEGRTASNYFDEQTYLALNPDVAAAVKAGIFRSGFQHWLMYGRFEGREAV